MPRRPTTFASWWSRPRGRSRVCLQDPADRDSGHPARREESGASLATSGSMPRIPRMARERPKDLSTRARDSRRAARPCRWSATIRMRVIFVLGNPSVVEPEKVKLKCRRGGRGAHNPHDRPSRGVGSPPTFDVRPRRWRRRPTHDLIRGSSPIRPRTPAKKARANSWAGMSPPLHALTVEVERGEHPADNKNARPEDPGPGGSSTNGYGAMRQRGSTKAR